MTHDHHAAPPPANDPPDPPDPHAMRTLPGDIVMTFVRWIGIGAVVGAVALGFVGLWYLGLIGLVLGVALGAIAGGVAGLMLLFWLNWPF